MSRCIVTAGEGWRPPARTRDEALRLAEEMEVAFAAPGALPLGEAESAVLIAGDRLPPAAAIRAALLQPRPEREDAVRVAPGEAEAEVARRLAAMAADRGGASARLAAAGRAALRATAKPTDGIVSRTINRPISRAISGVLLAIPGMRPGHATVGTAVLAVAMVVALLTGTDSGLVAGALLFQAASIFDGVDGEIARATMRTSRRGAMLDSLIDAATNLSFILGLSLNLLLQGEQTAGQIGLAGLACLGFGLFLIGSVAARRKAPFSFDLVKEYYGATATGAAPSALARWLTFLTSRDFFALGFALMIIAGFATEALAIFALVAAGWLLAVLPALAPRRA